MKQSRRAHTQKSPLREEEEVLKKELEKLRKDHKSASLHKAPWGVDQRQFSSNSLRVKQAEIEEQRSKRRLERERVKRQGRTRIGLDLIPDFKYPSRPRDNKALPVSPPHRHAVKETDPAVLDFMVEKRRRLQLEAHQREVEEQLQEERREKALARLQSEQKRELARSKPKQLKRKKRKTKRRKPTAQAADPIPAVPVEKNLYKKLRELLRSKAQQIRDTGVPVRKAEELRNAEKHASLLAKMEQLSAQLARTKQLMAQNEAPRHEEQVSSQPSESRREEAAIVLQRFVRKCLARRKANPQKEKTLQLSAVAAQAEEKEKESDLDLSLKSFGSFLDRGERAEQKRPTDSLDFLARYNAQHEDFEYKEQLVDRFRKSLDDHYQEIEQKTPEDQEPSLLNTLRSAEYSPSLGGEESLGWDQHPVPPAPPSPVASEEEKADNEDPRPTIPETGGSPNDSSLPEDTDSASPFPEAPAETRLSDLIGDSPRSLGDMFEPKMRFAEEVPPFQQTSLRIPSRGRFALDMAQVVAKVTLSPGDPSEESASIGALIRSGPESPEVLSFREHHSARPGLTPDMIDAIVEELLRREVMDLAVLASQYVGGRHKPVDTSGEFVITFLERLLEELMPMQEEFMRRFNQPRSVDMLQLLGFVASAQVGISVEQEFENLVPEDVFQRICESLSVFPTQVDESSFQAPYCRLLVEVVNEALNILRPEGERGAAPPWRTGTRDNRQFPDLLSVLRDVRDLMLAWSQAEVGKIVAEEEAANAQQIQENCLSNQLLREVMDTQVILQDVSWTNYETEETQVKLDLGDFILTHLIDETLSLLR